MVASGADNHLGGEPGKLFGSVVNAGLGRVQVGIKSIPGPWPACSAGWTLSRGAKGHQFDSRWGRMSGLRTWSWLGACERQPIDVSLPLFLPPFPSL